MAVLWLIEWGLRGRLSGPVASTGVSREGGLTSRSGSIFAGLLSWLRSNPTRWLTLAAAFFLGATLLSTVLSVSFDVSLWGEVPGQDSYSAYTTVAYVLPYAVIATHLRTPAQLWRLLGAMAVMGLLVAGYAILQEYDLDIFDLMVPPNGARATSTMSNLILAGSVMLMTIPVSLVAAAITLRGPIRSAGYWWKLGLWGVILAVQLLGLFFTFSRGPWVGTGVALVGFIGLAAAFAVWDVLIQVIKLSRHDRGVTLLGFIGLVAASAHWRIVVRAVMVLVLAFAIASAIVFWPSGAGEDEATTASAAGGAGELIGSVVAQVPAVGGQFGAAGLSGRVELWQESWGLMTQHPWFEFDSLSFSFLRPLVGYGPDLFHATYLLVSPPWI